MRRVPPLTGVRTGDEAIDLAIQGEHGFRHTASMHSRNIDKLSKMARACDCSIFVKNGPNAAGLGYGGGGATPLPLARPPRGGATPPPPPPPAPGAPPPAPLPGGCCPPRRGRAGAAAH